MNHRNTPGDTVLGSPAQRLISRRAKTLLPATEELLGPRVVNAERVQERLQHYKNMQKKSYDKRSKDLPILKEGDVVRIQGEKGFSKKGVVLEKAGHPRSYQVKKLEWCIQKKSKTSFESRREEEVPVEEQDDIPMEEPQKQGALPLEYNEDSTMTMTKSPERLIYTRSGRLVKKPGRLNL